MAKKSISISLLGWMLIISCSGNRNNNYNVKDREIVSPSIAKSKDSLSFGDNSHKDFAYMFFADSASMKELPDGVFVPSFFVYEGQERFSEDLYSLDLYKYDNVTIFYCGLTGNWGCFDDEFPARGTYLSKECSIDTITYYSKRGIFSGFMDDGSIFYMKKRIWQGDFPHPTFWGIIYPRKFNEAIKPIINKIKDWDPAYTWDDEESYTLRHLPE